MMGRYENLLHEMAQNDDRIVVLTAENRANIRNLPSLLGSRFIDTGITEQTMVGMAAGLALRGRIPVVHALATFLTLRAFEFIRTDVGIAHLPVKLVGAVPGFLSEANGPTHQAIEDIGILRTVPGMHLFCPADEADLLSGLPAVLHSPNPTYIRYPNNAKNLKHSPFQLGCAETFRDGTEVALLTYGPLLHQCLEAADDLEEHGFSTRVVHFRMVSPLDIQTALDTFSECRTLVVVEDHFQTGGLYSALCELAVSEQMNVSLHSHSLKNRWFRPALLPDVLAVEGFNASGIAKKVLSILEGDNYHA